MQELFVEQDLFVCLVQHCAVDDLENLYACGSALKELLSSPFVLSTLCRRFGIKKTFTSLYYFLEEYNHRFCRAKCPEQDLDLHLLWVVKDGDTQTLKDILETYPYTTDRWSDDKIFYQLYFQAGCRADYGSFDLLKKKGLCIRGISREYMFMAGLAYAGQTKSSWPLPTSLPDLRLILHEATRGGHSLECELKSHSTTALAYAAADNAEKLLPLLDYEWQYEEISFYEEQYFGWHSGAFSNQERLIACALYHQSWKALDLLTKNYTLPKLFKSFLFLILM